MSVANLKAEHLEDRFREYIKMPRNIAEQWRKFIADRSTGSFEIHVVDGVVKSVAKRSLVRAE